MRTYSFKFRSRIKRVERLCITRALKRDISTKRIIERGTDIFEIKREVVEE